ncbi:hypothetical protein FACS189490_05060 [Clostridia bacterium]|nr:hypothetical protein FACS189490_05060 [Clostridia bacterium]
MKFIKFLLAIGAVALLCSCSKSALKVSDYMPINADETSYFDGSDEQISYSAFTTYIDGNRYQQNYYSSFANPAEVYELKDGKLTLVYELFQAYSPQSFLNEPSNVNLIVLCEPLKKGAKWTRIAGETAEITAVDKKITVPYGELSALEVTVTRADGTINKEYYAKGRGKIRLEYVSVTEEKTQAGEVLSSSQTDVSQSLSEVVKGARAANFVRFFVDEIAPGGLGNEVSPISIPTNADIDKLFAEKLSIGEFTATVNAADYTAVIAIPADFADGLTGALDFYAFTNTVCYFYGLNAVNVTVDGKTLLMDGVDSENGYVSFLAPPEEEE